MLDQTGTLPPYINAVLENPLLQTLLNSYTIKIVAPGSGTCLKKVEQLRSWAPLTIDIPSKLIDPAITFHANTDEERFEQLKDALYAESEHTIVWTLRGGYGSARLIDQLLTLPAPKQEKIFIGFSDNTALHLFLSQHWQWKTIHGAGFLQLLERDVEPENYLRIARIIAKSTPTHTIHSLTPCNHQAMIADNISGYLTGGNLTLVENSIGTAWQIETAQKIVFLEEVGEKSYRIDRSLNHLRQAALLTGLVAIVFGQFTNDHPDDAPLIQKALQRFAQETPIPIYQTNQFGHGNKNYPLVYNSFSQIKAGENMTDYELSMAL